MGDFAYNNTKNTSTGHTPFYLNCGFYPRVSFEDNVDPRFRSCFADKLAKELRELMDICQQNLLHTQKLQKKAHDKGVKPQSYAPREKVWLNSKYITIKWNQKLEAKFFGLFQILHLVGKQAYKLDLPTKWKIHNVFHGWLLEQDTTRKGRMNELFPEPEPDFNAGNNKEYKVDAIINSAVYAKEAKRHLPGLYYLVSWKNYPEEKSTWEPSSAIMHLWEMISIFHKDYPKNPMAISPPLNSAPLMAKPSFKLPVKPFVKWKQGRLIGSTKQAIEWDIGRWGFSFPILVRLEGFFTNSVEFWEFYQFCELWERCSFSIIFQFCKFLSMSSELLLSSPFKSSTSLLCFLSMSGKLPPVFWFSSSVSHWVRRFFIRLVLRFSSSVSHWVRRFFTHHALSSFTLARLHAQQSLRPRRKAIVILWLLSPAPYGACQYWDLQDWSHVTRNVTSLDIDFYIYLSKQSSILPHRQRHRFRWKDVVAT